MPDDVIGSAFVALRSEDSRLQSDMESQLTKALGPVVAKGAKILGGLFLGKQVVGVARAGIAELAEAGKQTVLLGGQLRATGGAAGITAQHVQDLAAANLQLAGTDDEVTLASERVLLQFNRITAAGGIFDETLRSAQDLALVNSQELPAATRALGLALQDPIHASRALLAENVKLNVSQQEQIKNFIATGNVLGAQRVILDQVARTVGGAAEQYGDTLAGDLQRAQEQLENTKASLLEGAVPAIELFANASSAASEAVQGLPVGLRTLAAGLIGLAGFSPSLLSLRSTLLSVSASKATLAASEATGAGSTAANTAAIEANTTALLLNVPATERAIFAQNALALAEGKTAVGAAAATGATRGFMASLALFAIPAAAVLAIGEGLAQAFGLFGQSSMDLSVDLKGAIPSVADFTAELQDQHGVVSTLLKINDDYANQVLGQSIPAAKNLADAEDATGHSSASLREKIAAAEQAERQLEAQRRGLTAAELDAVQAEEALAAAQSERLDIITTAATAEQALERSQRGLSDAQRSLSDAQRSLNEALRAASAEDRAKAELSLTEAQIGSATAAKNVAQEEATLERLRHGTTGTTEELVAQESRLADARAAADRAQRSLAELERDARINARRGIATTREQRFAIEDAQRAAADAAKSAAAEEAKLRELRSPASLAAITEQEARLEQARIAQQRATFAVTDAEMALQEVQAKGSESDQAVIDARGRVADASRGVQDAYKNEADAVAVLLDAQDRLAGKTETAITKATNLRASLGLLLNQMAPGSPGRKNIEDEIALLDQLLGKGAVGSVIGNALSGGGGGQNVLAQILGIFGIQAANGFAGTLTQPTGILAGERPEDVLIVPHAMGGIQVGGSAGATFGPGAVVVQFHGVVPTESEAYRTGQGVGAGINDVLTRQAVRTARKIA